MQNSQSLQNQKVKSGIKKKFIKKVECQSQQSQQGGELKNNLWNQLYNSYFFKTRLHDKTSTNINGI